MEAVAKTAPNFRPGRNFDAVTAISGDAISRPGHPGYRRATAVAGVTSNETKPEETLVTPANPTYCMFIK
jgi:hypothetical protein